MVFVLDLEAAKVQIEAYSRHRMPSAVTLEVSSKDGMYDTPEHYFRVGAGALAAIQSFANLWGLSQFNSIMDFGCGHGRVLRWLRAAYPDAAIVGTDLDDDGTQFCAKTFGSQPLPSFCDFDQINPDRKFDLIFAGSVITHLPERSSKALMNKFIDWLNPGGVAVFSTHGSKAASKQMTGVIDYTAGGDRVRCLTGYFETGYGYASYPKSYMSKYNFLSGGEGYGVTFTKPEWFLRFFENDDRVYLTSIVQQGWDFHHDIVAFVRC
ncbi:MAG: class I SAM-dependent methyltransferase [Beijerinckiaceae bacterium]